VINPDQQLHAFRTFMGMPATEDDPPACGAVLTPAYGNVPKLGRCVECDRLVQQASPFKNGGTDGRRDSSGASAAGRG
jgi:hypothetical protein